MIRRWLGRQRPGPDRPRPTGPDAPRASGDSRASRLEAVGRALDHHPADLRDVAVRFADGTVLVHALGWRSGGYNSGWVATTLRLARGGLVPHVGRRGGPAA